MALLDSAAPSHAAQHFALSAAEDLYRLGLVHSSGGAGVSLDLVQAHMFFNLAAMNGSQEAKRCRKELAEQMTSAQIAAAQRAAREWLAARGRLH